VVLEIEPDAALRQHVADVGFSLADDDDVILTRELLATGRSQGRVNGVAASASQLRAIAASIVDVVGQHDAQQLLAPTFALETVDRCGGAELARVAADVRALHREWEAVESELAELRRDDGQLVAELEFARFAVAEIDATNLADAEDERLRERREVLVNAEKIGTALAVAAAALADEHGAVDAAGTAANALAGIVRFGDRFAALATAVGALQSETSEIATRLARERDAVEAEPAELEAVLARLEQIDRVKRKYGGTLAAVRASRSAFAARIERDAGREGRIAELVTASTRLRRRLDERAVTLSGLRRTAADQLEVRVGAELRALAMPNGRFSVTFEPLERPGPAGAERAEFRLAANSGEPQRPLAKSASGGELSRVLLALVVAIADRREQSALVFDEIDAGIGGATAAAVGARLGLLARAGQVVVVTHLAQIASWADAARRSSNSRR
jgi:DNA repair protein RecN (Recombination protein N)